MRNRFNRSFGPEQVEALLFKLRDGAMSRQESDPSGADMLFKCLHMITTLWRECSMHDNLTAEAEQVLDATEGRLRDCLEKQSIEEAAAALAEVERLKALIKEPPVKHEAWSGDASLSREGKNF
jgi:hypothetical protein